MLTIADHDRRIARLKRLLSAEKTARQHLVVSKRNKERHQDPAYRERFRAGRRAKDIATGRALPPMTPEQRRRYDNCKTHYHMTRAEALEVVFPRKRPDYRTNTISAGPAPQIPARAGLSPPRLSSSPAADAGTSP